MKTRTESSLLLRKKQAAALIGVSERTLERWRQDGAGPPVIEIQGGVYYSRANVEEWIARIAEDRRIS